MEAEQLSGSLIRYNNQEELLKSAKEKMGEVKEENQRLKKVLAKIMQEYQSLEKKISSMAAGSKQSTETTNSSNRDEEDDDGNHEETELVSLTLGSWSSTKKKHSNNSENNHSNKQSSDDNTLNKRRKVEGELELGLDDYCKKIQQNPSTTVTGSIMNNSSLVNAKKEQLKENTETWTSNNNGDVKEKENEKSSKEGDDQESLHQPQVKKTRVCIRSRCDSPTIHDGCHWRKYGQKIAKGNPCPRAYYRCTVSPTCPVRKQVQRCPHDMSILITTYEGNHNHPLPLSATAMASATSAAAAMIKSNSLTSQTPTLTRPVGLTTSSLGLHNNNMSSSLITNTFNNNPSFISASSHNSHPTVTLDLTLPNSGFTSFDWLSSSSSYSSSSRNSSFLNFSSSPASSSLPSLDFSTTPSLPTNNTTSWANGYLLPYNNHHHNNVVRNNTSSTNTNSIYQNPSNKDHLNNNNSHQQQPSLNETIAAVATKAIASNPNFQSVLALAISSYVGNKANNNNNNNNNNNGSNDQSEEGSGRSLTLFPTPLSLSTSKNNASVAADARDNIS